jgi:hypothetical protein
MIYLSPPLTSRNIDCIFEILEDRAARSHSFGVGKLFVFVLGEEGFVEEEIHFFHLNTLLMFPPSPNCRQAKSCKTSTYKSAFHTNFRTLNIPLIFECSQHGCIFIRANSKVFVVVVLGLPA